MLIAMNSHTDQSSSPSDPPLKILQLNTRRSSSVLHSLLNDSTSLQFLFLLIQEPYIAPGSNRPVSHPSWVPFLLQVPGDPDNLVPEDSTIKTLIYANKRIPSTALRPLNLPTNCITAVAYSLQTHVFLLISSYAPPPSRPTNSSTSRRCYASTPHHP